jgi:hypothetical protein
LTSSFNSRFTKLATSNPRALQSQWELLWNFKSHSTSTTMYNLKLICLKSSIKWGQNFEIYSKSSYPHLFATQWLIPQ